MIDLENAADSMRSYLSARTPDSVLAGMKPLQIEAFESVAATIAEGKDKMFVRAPMAFGKTRLQKAIYEAIDERTLICVPTKDLVIQTAREFNELSPTLPAGVYYSDEKDLSKPVVVTTYNSWINARRRGIIRPGDFPVELFDEAHHILSIARMEAARQSEGILQIGFTATPAYGLNKHLRDLLETEAFRLSIRENVENDMACSFSTFLADTGENLDEIEIVTTGLGKDYNPRALAQLVNTEKNNRLGVALYKDFLDGEIVLVSCCGIAHAKAVAERFQKDGIRAGVIHGYLNPSEKQDLRQRWHEGDISVLTYADMLNEGIDEVRVSGLINLRPTKSPLLAEQRGGRVLRLDPECQGKYAFIIDALYRAKNRVKKQVLFATVAERAAIVNRTFLGANDKKFLPFTDKDLPQAEGIKIIHKEEEIMWVVNGEYSEFSIGDSDWMSLNRISAETGIGIKFLQRYLARMGNYLLKIGRTRVSETPFGNKVTEIFLPEVYDIVELLINERGYCTVGVEPYYSSDIGLVSRYNRYIDVPSLVHFNERIRPILLLGSEKYLHPEKVYFIMSDKMPSLFFGKYRDDSRFYSANDAWYWGDPILSKKPVTS